MSKRKKNTPYSEYTPTTKQTPRVKESVTQLNQCTLAWKFSRCDLGGYFGWDKVNDEKFRKIIMNFLSQFEGRKWSDILGKRSNPHSQPVDTLSKKAQKRLRELKLHSDTLFRFRLGQEVVWGFRDDNNLTAMQLLWWDPKHEVYKVTKKHT